MLAKLRAQHKKIAQLKVAGSRTSDIALEVDMTVATVNQILNDPLCEAYMATMQDKAEDSIVDVRKRLANMNGAALDVIENMLTDDKAPLNLALKASQDVLDRNGYKPADNINMNHNYLDKDEILAMKKRAKEAGAQLGVSDFFPNMVETSTERATEDTPPETPVDSDD